MNHDEAAKFLRISTRKLWDLVKDNLVPSIKLGGRRLYDPEQLRAYLHKRYGTGAQ